MLAISPEDAAEVRMDATDGRTEGLSAMGRLARLGAVLHGGLLVRVPGVCRLYLEPMSLFEFGTAGAQAAPRRTHAGA